MQKITFALCIFLTLAIVSVSSLAQTKTKDSGSDTQKTIQDRLNQYANALVNNDYASLDNFFTDDAISMPNYGKMLNGKNAIHNDNMQMGKSGMKINSLDLSVSKVINDKGDMATAIGTFTISMSGKDNKMMKDEGNFMSVLQKQAGTWKIKAEIWNTSTNPWMNKSMGGQGNMNNMNNMNMKDSSGMDTSRH